MEYEAVIGLEVHAQLLTESKIFCSCATAFGAEPNSHTCPVCMGLPGSLPVVNRKAVEFAIRMGLATHCTIARRSLFARKNYFYPDLPKGYQISQYEMPLAEKGYVEVFADGETRRVGIIRVHLEEDAGKLIHQEESTGAGQGSLVDFNRTGVPLIEIVSAPDIRTAREAGDYLRTLSSIVQYLEICDGKMEEGSLRCDANVSVRPRGQEAFGVRTELKNMNSFRHVEKALDYEIERQIELCEAGEQVVQETRLWDPHRSITVAMRGKEEAQDYRYFPDPDLLPLVIDGQWVEEIRKGLPELPVEKRRRFVRQYEIPEYDAGVLTSSKALADYYEACVAEFPEPKTVSNWVMGELLGLLNRDNREVGDSPVTPSLLGELLRLIGDGTISGKIAKAVFEEMYLTGKDASRVVREKGLVQVTDPGVIEETIGRVLEANPDLVQAYRKGKEKVFGFLVGQVMKETQGKANPRLVNEILKKKLTG
ncbi:MAG: Asp-tRNA(Asn)/Glu-tRNA(Gln) amidotransferase subunit GatB [Deltaproteobacteria bacterium]|nr:Asp-tRNA(Asn)/Glu-tRNA(Gln) amidotransferase subunit GatB [Deltaproteobacteria bacterium]MBW2121070.1 Asp-tRNA(Asn)/Glu-tRNA(Gln) amidotransferase subunit GatB [Deltaproteobacteria bacterium]